MGRRQPPIIYGFVPQCNLYLDRILSWKCLFISRRRRCLSRGHGEAAAPHYLWICSTMQPVSRSHSLLEMSFHDHLSGYWLPILLSVLKAKCLHSAQKDVSYWPCECCFDTVSRG